jgi:hypothetical protein
VVVARGVEWNVKYSVAQAEPTEKSHAFTDHSALQNRWSTNLQRIRSGWGSEKCLFDQSPNSGTWEIDAGRIEPPLDRRLEMIATCPASAKLTRWDRPTQARHKRFKMVKCRSLNFCGGTSYYCSFVGKKVHLNDQVFDSSDTIMRSKCRPGWCAPPTSNSGLPANPLTAPVWDTSGRHAQRMNVLAISGRCVRRNEKHNGSRRRANPRAS